jgi:hypothetical protein
MAASSKDVQSIVLPKETPARWKCIEREDHGCVRQHFIDILGRNPNSACLRRKNLRNMMAVQTLNMEVVEKYGFSLNNVTTEAGMKYLHIKDPEIRQKVLMQIKQVIETDTDPFVDKQLARAGVTSVLVGKMIEFATTGEVKRRQKNHNDKVALPSRDLDLLDVIIGRAIKLSKTDSEKTAIRDLVQKLKDATKVI